MELKNLYTFVVIIGLVSLLLGIIVLTMEKVGESQKTSTAVTDEDVTISSGAGQLAFVDIVSGSLTGSNASQSINTTNGDWNVTMHGVITTSYVDSDGEGNNYTVSYSYYAHSNTTTAMYEGISALQPIADTWLTLIVTVTILGIILTIVLTSFAIRNSKR